MSYPQTSPYYLSATYNNEFLDVMVNRPIPMNGDDSYWEITQTYHMRPDLLAYDFYVQETDEHWEKIYLAEMKFNRLVMYKQNMLHTPYIPANSFTNETPRLIQMFFI